MHELNLRLKDSVYEQLCELAKRRRRSVKALAVELLKEKLEDEDSTFRTEEEFLVIAKKALAEAAAERAAGVKFKTLEELQAEFRKRGKL